jgi:hypothetical protein
LSKSLASAATGICESNHSVHPGLHFSRDAIHEAGIGDLDGLGLGVGRGWLHSYVQAMLPPPSQNEAAHGKTVLDRQ